MNVLFINQYYYPELASTGQLLTELCEDLAKLDGFNITVLSGLPSYETGKGNRDITRSENINGVKVRRAFNTTFSRERTFGRLLNYLSFFFSVIFKSIRYCKKQDLVVTMTDPPFIGLVGYLASKLSDNPFLYISQDVFPEAGVLSGELDNKFIVFILDRINRLTIKRADWIVAVGEKMQEKLVNKGVRKEKIKVIHNWMDTDLVYPESKDNEFSKKYGLNDKFVVMYSGNIGIAQDFDALMKAADLLKWYEEIIFLIIGGGTKKQEVRQKAKKLNLNNLLFLSYQPKEKLRYSLATADISVIIQKSDLTGYRVPSKLYGILASGRPVLAAIDEESEVAQIIEDEECGIVVDPGNAGGLAEAIDVLYRDADLREKYANNAWQAADKYSRKQAVKHYEELFLEISSSKNNS